MTAQPADRTMTALWARIEPLLGQVQKPARYIGCEDGAITPRYGPGKVSWLLAYPDAYEVGLPNQGLQILYEILNERDDAVAERTYAPVDRPVGAAAPARPAAVLRRHPPRRRRLRPAGVQPVVGAGLHERARDDRPRRRARAGRRPRRRSIRWSRSAATRRSTPSRSPTSSTSSCSARARRSSARSPRSSRRGSPAAALIARGRAARRWPRCRACTCRRCTTSSTTARRSSSITPRFADVPATVDKRTVADLGAWPYPKHQLVPLTEVVHDRLNVEVFRGCTRGCRFCQAGMITRPVRERPADQVRTMVADGLRRTGYDEVALTSLSTADLSGIEAVVGGILADHAAAAAGLHADGQPAVAARRRLHRRPRRPGRRAAGAAG